MNLRNVVLNPDYGFIENASTRDKLRCCKPSDYTVASRGYTTRALGGEYDRNTYYWTRSIAYNYPSYVLCVNDFGNITREYGHETVSGIRPAINIHL